jgi:flagellar protein FliO/FliZ
MEAGAVTKKRPKPQAPAQKESAAEVKGPSAVPVRENPVEGKETAGTREEAAAPAENDLYTYEKPEVEEESYAWVIIKTLLVLGFMVGGFYYFLRFVTRRAGISPAGGAVLQVLSMIPLGQNKFLQVVDLAGRVLVLGVSDNSINLIMEIRDKDEIDRIRLLGSKAAPVRPGGFQEFLTSQIGRLLNKYRRGPLSGAHERHEVSTGEENQNLDRIEYIERQRERLRRLNGIADEE